MPFSQRSATALLLPCSSILQLLFGGFTWGCLRYSVGLDHNVIIDTLGFELMAEGLIRTEQNDNQRKAQSNKYDRSTLFAAVEMLFAEPIERLLALCEKAVVGKYGVLWLKMPHLPHAVWIRYWKALMVHGLIGLWLSYLCGFTQAA